MDAHPEEDLGIPWVDRCLRSAFPTYPEGIYVSYDYAQEGDFKQRAEAFCVTPTALLLAAMRTEQHMAQEWEIQTLEVTRVPLRRIRHVTTTTKLVSERGEADFIESFGVTIEIDGDLPSRGLPSEPWEATLTVPRRGDYRDPKRASEVARRFEEALSNSL